MSDLHDLDHFGYDDAWRLGVGLVERCRAQGFGVTILITLGEQRVFHAALPGTSADNDGWVERKARTVRHFGLASLEVFERDVRDNPQFFEAFALSPARYAPYGGAVPITVRGSLVGVLAISGLESEHDHALAVDALAAEAALQSDGGTGVHPARRETPDQSARPDASTMYRTLQPRQRAQVWIGGPNLAQPELLLETTDLLIEAPNWSADGDSLYVNGNGQLWSIDLRSDAPTLTVVPFTDLPAINNDHVLAPDGKQIYLSAMDGHIYRGLVTGGAVERVTPDDGVWHFLHGVSPDGSRLAYVALTDFAAPGRLAVMELGGTPAIIDTGAGHLDGPEWSPDGDWIYVNTESFTSVAGHAQLGRVPDGGGPIERLLTSPTVDWFPHLSPDGQLATYISFPSGTIGHPADLDVEVKVVATSDWDAPLQIYPLFGGQGTVNVNSWAPDSTRFAFIAYPLT